MWSISLLVFILGLIIGSFLNVVIYRRGTGLSVGRGRSKCFNCGKVLHWYELIPVASFIIQYGRCRGCRSNIAWQYPLVELLTALLFLAVWQLALPLALLPFYLVIVSLLVVILVYDWRHRIIPDGPVFALIGLSLATVVLKMLLGWGGWWLLVSALLAGGLFFLAFWALWYFSGGHWMGFGDAKLVLAVGLLLGLADGLTALVLAFWSGALVGVLLILFGRLLAGRRRVTMKSEVPFAPFIILGLLLVLFFSINVLPF